MAEQTYASLEGYKTTELGPLPEEWEVVRLGELFQIQQGKAVSKKHRTGESSKPFLRTANVLWGHLDLTTLDEMDFTENEMERLSLLPNDLLVCEGGDVGRTAIWCGELEQCYYQNHLHRLRSERADVEPYFYMYWMQAAILLLNLYSGAGNKTTIPNLSRSRLGAFAVPLPPLPEQRAIARMLRTVQQAKEATEKVIVAARELKKSLMRHLFTYGPVPVEEAESVPLKETQFRLVPEKWRIMSLSECASVQTGVTKGRKLGGSHIIEVPYLRVANVQDGYLDLEKIKRIRIRESEIERYRLRIGDVLLTEGGDFDKLGRGFVWQEQIPNCVHQNHIFAVRADKRDLMPEYLAYLAQSQYGKAYFLNVAHRTTNLASINSTKLKAFPVLIPPLPEQREIARILSAVDSKIAAEENRKRTLEALFKTLLHHLMTGKLRVKSPEGGRRLSDERTEALVEEDVR